MRHEVGLSCRHDWMFWRFLCNRLARMFSDRMTVSLPVSTQITWQLWHLGIICLSSTPETSAGLLWQWSTSSHIKIFLKCPKMPFHLFWLFACGVEWDGMYWGDMLSVRFVTGFLLPPRMTNHLLQSQGQGNWGGVWRQGRERRREIDREDRDGSVLLKRYHTQQWEHAGSHAASSSLHERESRRDCGDGLLCMEGCLIKQTPYYRWCDINHIHVNAFTHICTDLCTHTNTQPPSSFSHNSELPCIEPLTPDVFFR